MPVDEDAIQEKIVDLSKKLTKVGIQRSDLRSAIDGLNRIKKVQKIVHGVDGEGNPTTTKTMETPVDIGTGEKFNIARRQTVYDAQMKNADDLLNL